MRWIATALLSTLVVLALTDTTPAQPLLRRLEERLRSAAPRTIPPPRNSTLRPVSEPARLGVRVDEVTPQAVSQYNLAVRRGALIVAMEAGSAADQAGLPIGGVIVAVDGIRIDSANELVNLVRGARPGQPLELTYYQGRRLFRKTIQLTPTAETATPVPAPGPTPGPAGNTANPALGAAGQELADALGQSDRPLLNRLGQLLDGFVAPGSDPLAAPAVPTEPLPNGPLSSGPLSSGPDPLTNGPFSAGPLSTGPTGESVPPPLPSPPGSELQTLRQQVSTLQSQVDLLTKRLAELEQELKRRDRD